MAQQEDSPFGLHAVDDFYCSALFDDDDETGLVPVSDDKYAQELQFQETLMASLITSQNASFSLPSSSSSPPPSPFLCFEASSSKTIEVSLTPMKEKVELVTEEEAGHVSLSDDKYAQELQFQEALVTSQNASSSSPSSITPPPSPKAVEVSLTPKKKRKVEEAGESSLIICEICAETKGRDEMFLNQRCDHSFCSDCVTKQVATKIQDNITVVSCPGGLNCKGVLELDACRSMLPKDLIDRWDDALCEALLLTAQKFYCPFKDCSAMMLDDNEEGKDIRESECPFCHRLFCARCHVPWHPGVGCEEFQTLNEDERGRGDLLVRKLANEKEWSRCPQCKFYVEKTGGCLHITCRCQFQFCYACGEQWTSTHGGCQRN